MYSFKGQGPDLLRITHIQQKLSDLSGLELAIRTDTPDRLSRLMPGQLPVDVDYVHRYLSSLKWGQPNDSYLLHFQPLAKDKEFVTDRFCEGRVWRTEYLDGRARDKDWFRNLLRFYLYNCYVTVPDKSGPQQKPLVLTTYDQKQNVISISKSFSFKMDIKEL